MPKKVPNSPPAIINQPILISKVFLNQCVKAPELDEARILFEILCPVVNQNPHNGKRV